MSVTVESNEGEQLPGVLPNGLPDPEYAASLGIVDAPIGRRALSAIIDGAVLAVLALPAIIIVPGLALDNVGEIAASLPRAALVLAGVILLNAVVIIQVILHGLKGVTLGKAVTGIRSVNVSSLTRPGFWRIVLRDIVLYFSGVVVPLLGAVVMMMSAVWGARGRSWLDTIGSNWMIDVRHGLNPYDQKALRLARKKRDASPAAEAPSFPSLATGASPAEVLASGARSRSAVVGGFASLSSFASEGGPPIPSRAPTPVPAEASRHLVSSPPVPTVPHTRVAVLVSDDGRRYDVDGEALLGRNPESKQGEPPLSLISIGDPSFSISKTHAVVGVDDNGVWIEDRNSSNGTSVVGADGVEAEVLPGTRAHAPWGSSIMLGHRRFDVRERENER
ncbi:RDD family protein [Glaciihabitans sp. UYNi722]|uniref:RDD family protein n=1 Tax=Glaciihabitans sp. UYNi722 TaxID=3156344 RepID=UPI0033940209